MAVGQFIGNNNPDGMSLGYDTTELVSLYGVTPVSQRAGAVQASSLMSAGSYVSVTSNLAAILAEIGATLTALGVWKGGA